MSRRLSAAKNYLGLAGGMLAGLSFVLALLYGVGAFAYSHDYSVRSGEASKLTQQLDKLYPTALDSYPPLSEVILRLQDHGTAAVIGTKQAAKMINERDGEDGTVVVVNGNSQELSFYAPKGISVTLHLGAPSKADFAPKGAPWDDIKILLPWFGSFYLLFLISTLVWLGAAGYRRRQNPLAS